MIREANAREAGAVSRLHYLAGEHFFRYFFVCPEAALLKMLERLYETSDTFCSQKFWRVEAEQDIVKGGIAFYPGAQYERLARNIGNYGREIARRIGVGATLKMIVRGLLRPQMPAIDENELCIQALAVFPEYQGQGIASQLLRTAFGEAARLGLPKLSLLVETQNTRAQAVYEHSGFRIAATQHLPRRFHKHDIYGLHKMVAEERC